VNSVCLPSAALQDRIRQFAPELDIASSALIWDGSEPAESVAPDLADVEFWVPAFLHADPAGARAAIEQMPRLRVVQTQTAGVDTFVGLVEPPVLLCDARGVHGSSTSEWALTAILSVLREFPRFERARQQRRWDYAVTDELAGKQVVIVGAGDVGDQLARRIRACDATPVMVARTARDGVYSIADLPTLLAEADVVVLLVPKTDETVGLVDAPMLALMRDGALLVNGARGPVVDTEALLAELQSGRLRAAIDVVEPEPLPADHPLWLAPNLLITPHVGGSVLGFPGRAARLIADQLRRFRAGEPLINVVSGAY
jgi:phosphoglycerate dehydrogenase-like enzyme